MKINDGTIPDHRQRDQPSLTTQTVGHSRDFLFMHEYNEEDIVVFVSLSSLMCVRYSEGHPDARPVMKKGRRSIGLLKSQPYSNRPSGRWVGEHRLGLKSVSVHPASIITRTESIVGGDRLKDYFYLMHAQRARTIPLSGN